MLGVLAPVAYAAVTDQQKAEIDALYQQIIELRQKIVDKYVEAGELTNEQGEAIKEGIRNMEEYHSKYGIVPGACHGGAGYGMMGGWGRGFLGSFGNNPNQGNQNSAFYGPSMMRGYMGL
nr:YckD family protein [Moorella sulfitireducens]